ncbi:MAG: thiol:disulfide interchange protein DsbA/DsbL [Gammaproteobacteria bacterium]|nr:thiol:disulfide interchange protein DsbA/DsbL [Gammaproteobacteria bacterium]
MKKLPVLAVLVVIIAAISYFVVANNEDAPIVNTNVDNQVAQAVEQNSEQSESEHETEIADAESTQEFARDDSHEHDVVATDDGDHEHEVYVAGKHYVVIDKPVETDTGDKVEVRELFWYYCGHCYNLEPYIHAMEATLTDKAEFVRQPAVFSERWEKGAVFFYVLKHLGEFDRLNTSLFNAIHRDGVEFNSQEDFVNWLNINGVDLTKANDAFKQYSVAVNVNKAKASSFKYQVQGVPTLVVNGKYWVDAAHAGSIEGIFKVVDYLIEKELH